MRRLLVCCLLFCPFPPWSTASISRVLVVFIEQMRQQFDRPLAQAERGRRKQQRAEDVRVSSQPASSSPARRGGRVLVAALICQLAVCVIPGRVTRAGVGAGCLCGGGAASSCLLCAFISCA
ncbi:hypothetical protein Y032_0148g2656 [Ancylostoma ceylanicum]|uniref:Secreted protein n=1 Tax=Ancylostoma ceylanicum TaxID=53326 RepID=A0A016T123_9BILA|nr:hypothetical protein Y032_0148g2656 [Ancylostoma ceylanicum]